VGGKLVKSEAEHPLAKRLDPEVLSKADPAVDWLLQARADLSRDRILQRIFLDARKEGRNTESVADAAGSYLAGQWGGHEDAAYEAALYLADEFEQLGEGIHLVSTETGRVIITLTEEDLWQPAMVPREGGGMAQPLKRIRPDLEALIVTWTFEKSREERIVSELARRGHQTALLREKGDPRLLVATRAGRRRIVQGLIDFTPEELLRAAGGTSGTFLRHWDLGTTEPPLGHLEVLQGAATARSEMGVQDQTTVNLHHNRAGTLQGALTQGWIRQMALHLAEERKRRSDEVGNRLRIQVRDLTADHLGQTKFWVAPPELVFTLQRLQPGCTVLPVDRAPLIGLTKPKVGVIVVPEEFLAENTERFDTWSVATHLDYTLWIDWDAIRHIGIEGIEYQAHVVK
jgi:hypothetical protein